VRLFPALIPTLFWFGVAVYPAGALELNGFAGLALGQATYPADNLLYTDREQQLWGGDFRLLAEAGDGELHFSANLLEAVGSKPPLAEVLAAELPKETERSALLTWEQHDSPQSRASLAADLLQLQYQGGTVDLILGRQPVSLATTFYFVPNDFFAPFAAENFFRTYKPGVDAFRVDLRLASLSQLTFLGVLAYNRDPDSANGWDRSPDWSRTALLARYTREWVDFGWTLLGGTVRDRSVAGGALQGEFFDWLGIRIEGHYGRAEVDGEADGGGLTVGLEHRYANNINWRLEYFYNGYPVPNGVAYGAHNFAALGAGWELTPLLTGGLVVLAALDDGSQLLAGNLLYSLSDESELALTGILPRGQRPAGLEPGSEFGRQPRQLLLEYRLYF
jgi:hypothetical protein